jgi:predicted enzyme related to lactoylglutathione lyase
MTNPTPATIVHLELHTGDLPGAQALCAKLCGWRSEQIMTGSGPYVALELGSELGGGIIQCGTRRATWLPYVEVVRGRHRDRSGSAPRSVGTARAARRPGGLA